MSGTSNNQIEARFQNKSDGHGAQFEIHFEKGASRVPSEIVAAIKSELQGGRSTLYVDGVRIENDNLVISLCRGSIVLAQVNNRWNSQRKDNKFHVIVREEMESDDDPNLPQFTVDQSSVNEMKEEKEIDEHRWP